MDYLLFILDCSADIRVWFPCALLSKYLSATQADYVFSINLIPVTTEIVWFVSVRELPWSILQSFSPTIQSAASHLLISIKWKTCCKEKWKRTTEKVCFINSLKKQLIPSLAWKWAEAAEVGRNAFVLLYLNYFSPLNQPLIRKKNGCTLFWKHLG